MKIYYIILLFIIFSCHSQTKKNEKDLKKIEKKEKKTNNQISTSLSYNDFMQLSKSDAFKKYGKPIKQERYLLGDMMGEFWNNIYFSYSEKERQSDTIFIQELTWKKDNDTLVTVWYEENKKNPIPKNIIIWDKEAEF